MPFRSLSRRAFLGASAAIPLRAPLLAARRPHLDFPTEPKQRLSVTSNPFRAYIESPTNRGRDNSKKGMDLKEFPGMIAKRFGVYNINPLGDHMSSTEPAYLDAFRKAVDDAKSHLVDLGLGGRNFASADPSVREEAVAYGRKWIDIAAALGAPSVRQHLSGERGVRPSVPNAAESLARMAEYGEKKNIVVNLENDSPDAEDPFFIVEVLEKVRSPYLRALPDFGNSLRGHDAAFNRKAVDAMFHHAFNMSHVKDVLGAKTGHQDHVDIPGMFAVARANAYKGYFSMEFDTAAGDAFEGTEHLVKLSLQYML
jgi:sugar phosphate isomerase/epimerase